MFRTFGLSHDKNGVKRSCPCIRHLGSSVTLQVQRSRKQNMFDEFSHSFHDWLQVFIRVLSRSVGILVMKNVTGCLSKLLFHTLGYLHLQCNLFEYFADGNLSFNKKKKIKWNLLCLDTVTLKWCVYSVLQKYSQLLCVMMDLNKSLNLVVSSNSLFHSATPLIYFSAWFCYFLFLKIYTFS